MLFGGDYVKNSSKILFMDKRVTDPCSTARKGFYWLDLVIGQYVPGMHNIMNVISV